MQTVTISGKPYQVAPRYTEGHTLTANEASALNQTYFENIRNNFAGKAKEGATQEDLDAYASGYQFGVRTGGGGGSRDPVESEAMNLAREHVKKTITKAGKKLSDYTAKAISEAAGKLVEQNPSFREAAKKRVEEMRSIASDSVGEDIMAVLANAQADANTDTPQGEGAEESGATEQPADVTVSEEEAAAETSSRGRRKAAAE